MRIVVLGASGLLGRSISDEFLGSGHAVVGVSRSGDTSARLAAEGTVVRTDLVAAADTELDELFDGADGVVYCLGSDDRTSLPVPVNDGLDRVFVTAAVRCAQAARRRQVKHFVILGSYFTTFDRLHPEWELSRRHPYIRARVDQAAKAEQASAPGTVSVLEIPYVFGAVPGLEPSLKKVLLDRLRRAPIGVTFPGGTAAVTNVDVARATAAIVNGDAAPGRYPLAVDNVTYRRLAEIALVEMGRQTKVVAVPTAVLTAGVVGTALAYRLRHRAMLLNPLHMAHDLLGRRLYLDPAVYSAPLGLVPGSIEDAIRQTVRAAYPPQA